jgi:hypothetical protein
LFVWIFYIFGSWLLSPESGNFYPMKFTTLVSKHV